MHEEALRVLLDGQLLNDEFLHIIAPPAIRGAATGALALGPGPVLLLVLVVVEIAVLLLPVRSAPTAAIVEFESVADGGGSLLVWRVPT